MKDKYMELINDDIKTKIYDIRDTNTDQSKTHSV
jgi:hypothetical protein